MAPVASESVSHNHSLIIVGSPAYPRLRVCSHDRGFAQIGPGPRRSATSPALDQRRQNDHCRRSVRLSLSLRKPGDGVDQSQEAAPSQRRKPWWPIGPSIRTVGAPTCRWRGCRCVKFGAAVSTDVASRRRRMRCRSCHPSTVHQSRADASFITSKRREFNALTI